MDECIDCLDDACELCPVYERMQKRARQDARDAFERDMPELARECRFDGGY